MQYVMLSATLFLWPIAISGQLNLESASGVKATPSDLAISCQIDPDSRLVSVTLLNRSTKRVYVQYANDIDARDNYEAIVTDQRGKRYPKPIPSPAVGAGVRIIHESALGLLVFDPQQKRIEEFPLSGLVKLPRDGRVRIKVGRRLAGGPTGSSGPGAPDMLWCKVIDVILSGVKGK